MSEPHVEPAKHSRIRSILAGVVGVIAVIGLLASVLAIWARWVVFNDDAVTNNKSSDVRNRIVNPFQMRGVRCRAHRRSACSPS